MKLHDLIQEAPLPPDWDEKEFGPESKHAQRIKYAVERAKLMGTGSARVAFEIEYQGRPTILKVAKNYKGLAQNAVEASILSDGYYGRMPIVIPMIDHAEGAEPTWLHVEKADPISLPQLREYFGVDLDTLLAYTQSMVPRAGVVKIPKLSAKALEHMFDGLTDQQQERIHSYANNLAELTDGAEVQLADFQHAANWGWFKGHPVVIDIGLNANVMTAYYK